MIIIVVEVVITKFAVNDRVLKKNGRWLCVPWDDNCVSLCTCLVLLFNPARYVAT